MAYLEIPVDKNVFRAYDIRGIVDHHFNENAFYSIGRAIALCLHSLAREAIFVARDGRLSSETLAKALYQGLLDSGIKVVDLGTVSTPVLYYATHVHGIDCGLMVTGSHNPAAYNGIKMVLAGKTLLQEDIENLYHLIQKAQFNNGQGHYSTKNILHDYSERIIKGVTLGRPLKVVVDCGNGIAGNIVPQVIKGLGCELIPLYCEVDGHFPNHHPDPSVEENLVDLKKAVLIHQADIGLAFDGDADRLGVVSNSGKIIWPDRLMMYYARALLKQNPNASIVYDIKCSANLGKLIQEAGGRPYMCPTGHSIVKGVMKHENAILAGEMSGHLFFKDRWYGFDDALYSACRLIELVSQNDGSVDEQFSCIPDSINTPEIKISIADDKKFLFMERFCAESEFNLGTRVLIDGLRVEFKAGWGLVRASNTTPCLVLRFEAKDKTNLHEIMSLFKEQLLRLDKTLLIPF